MKYKILIADDEVDMVTLLQARLEAEGYEIIVAYEGVRALGLAHREKPDLVILDLQMPAGSGQSVLHAMRTHADMAQIPVIILTGLGGEDIEQVMLAAGAQAFILKPCNLPELLLKIEALLSSPPLLRG